MPRAVLVYHVPREGGVTGLRAFDAALVLAFGAVLAVQGQGPSGSRVVVVAGDPGSPAGF